MIHLRVLVPPDLALEVVEVLEESTSVFALAHVRGASRRPPGDLVLCDCVREEASVVVARLRELGVERVGAISVHEIDTAISQAADRAERETRGAPADAVLWEQVEHLTSESARMSWSFGIFIVLATMIAATGILTDSLLPIIGAMIVGPDFGPLAAICVAAAEGRFKLAAHAAAALGTGLVLAVGFTYVGTELLRASGRGPESLGASAQPATIFISKPNIYSVVVALLAGAVGVLSLTTAKSGALIGVLISVTTIPAAANIAVAGAYSDWSEMRGAAAQLAVNIACIVLAGTATLLFQRVLFGRRLRRAAMRGAALHQKPAQVPARR